METTSILLYYSFGAQIYQNKSQITFKKSEDVRGITYCTQIVTFKFVIRSKSGDSEEKDVEKLSELTT